MELLKPTLGARNLFYGSRDVQQTMKEYSSTSFIYGIHKKKEMFATIITATPNRPAIVFETKKTPHFFISIKSYPSQVSSGENSLWEPLPVKKCYKISNEMSQERRSSRDTIGSDHGKTGNSEIMSMHNQIVRFDARSSSSEDLREAGLVVRLEKELTEAQICNHRLNQQLKVLVNSSNKEIKTELAETKKLLKEKANELEQLKKQSLKSNNERVMWLSKQPQEVSTLLAEKQELRKQLDREQSEKQELFIQINSMIAQLADSGDQEEINRLKTEVSSLKRELDTEKRSSNLETSRLKSELEKAKNDAKNSLKDGDEDKEAMEQEIENLQRQLDVKNASIQSLMLAKSNSNNGDQLSRENEELKHKVENFQKQMTSLQSQLSERTSEVQTMKDAVAMAEVSRKNMSSLDEKLAEMSRLLEEEKKQKLELETRIRDRTSSQNDSEKVISELRSKLNQSEGTISELRKEIEQVHLTQRDMILHDGERIRELNQKLSDETDNNAILNVQLREKDGKIDRIQIDLLAAQSRAQQAEQDVAQLRDQVLKSSNDEVMEQRLQWLEKELEKEKSAAENAKVKLTKTEASVIEKDGKLSELSRSLEEAKMQLSNVSGNLENTKTSSQNSIKQMESTISTLQQDLAASKQLHNDLLAEQKLLKAQPSVADEISTLMVSLNSLREDNSHYEEEMSSLQKVNRNMQEELYSLQDKCTSLQERAEKAEEELNNSTQRISEISLTRGSENDRMEEERRHLEETLSEALNEKEKAMREASDAVSKMKREMTETSIKSDRESQELKEKVASLTRDLDMTKRRMEQMQEDQTQFIYSNDESKGKLVEELQVARGEIDKITSELRASELKRSEIESDWKESEETSKDLRTKLEKAESKLEETKEHLQAAEELADRLQEAQILSGNVESKFTDMQNENKLRIEQMIKDHAEKIRVLEDKLQRSQMEQTSLETVLEEQQTECQLLQEQLVEQKELHSNQNEQLKRQETTISNLEEKLKIFESGEDDGTKKSKQLEVELFELRKVNEQLTNDAQKLSSSLETLQLEKKEMENEIESLKNSATIEKNEMSETTAENARLAGEILKFHSTAEKNLQEEREKVSKKFEERLKTLSLEKTRLASDLQMSESKCASLENKMVELQEQLENADKRRRADLQQLDNLREDLHQMRDQQEKLKGYSMGAPPKASTRTISNMSAMTNWTQADFSDCEDLTRLRSEIDKQKRLIIVLRRKLQGLQQS